MRAVDTNVLVRRVARDDARQVAAAEAFVARGGWVSQIVLVKTIWVLESVYELDRRALAKAVDMLLNHRDLTVQDADVVAAALAQFRQTSGAGFSDCLLLEVRWLGRPAIFHWARSIGTSANSTEQSGCRSGPAVRCRLSERPRSSPS